MRAIAIKAETAAESFAQVLDQFAALRSYTSAPTSIGGYRVLRPRQDAGAPKLSPALAALARARLRITGFLSVIFVGGLGLAVLAGPANCPCLGEFAAATEHTSAPRHASVSRFGYMQPAAAIAAGELAAQFAGELPMLSTAALLEPGEMTGVSPISTSATEPLRDVPAQASDDLAPARVGRLPRNIEELADVAPTTIRLAAAGNIESDAAPTLPAITVDTPAMPEVVAVEAEREHTGKTHASRGRFAAKATMRNGARASKEQAARLKAKQQSASKVAGQAPRWAQQMFETPWQTKAFSYYE